MSFLEELQNAVAALRCDHRFPVAPPAGSLAKPGDCRRCGRRWPGHTGASDELAEPLAKWLESVAKGVTDHDPDDGCECTVEDSYHRAIEVARVINGGAS